MPPPSTSGGSPAFPAVRAAFTQAALAAVSELEAGVARRIRGAIDPVTLTRITEASRLEWLPIELDMAVTDAITAALGPARCADFWRRSLLDTFETPILKPILDGAVNIFGLSPEGMIRWTPRVWEALYRNCGAMSVVARSTSRESRDSPEARARIVVEGMAVPLLAGTAFVEALRASIEVLFVVTRVHGEVRVAELSLSERRVAYALTWTSR